MYCKLKELMAAKNISQQELARETGLSPATVGKLYRNQANRTDFNTLTVLGEYFNLSSINELLDYVKEQSND